MPMLWFSKQAACMLITAADGPAADGLLVVQSLLQCSNVLK
jgi:hypothetical protein